jgi:hypothetical protein
MAQPRTFTALVDQDRVVVLEYRQEKTGFRVIDTRTETRRFATTDDAADVVIQLLKDMRARRPSLSIVLQHFGSFFHTMVLPPAADEHIRPIILREVQRSFNITDAAVAYTTAGSVERRDSPRSGTGLVPRQMLIAGAPHGVIAALHARFTKARIQVEGLTVMPEVFRRLYDALDGSTEATAMLVCLANGPHVAFFVNGRMEMAIDPPLALEGEAPLDSAVIVDQLERGAIFLRQQSRGTVATRLLLAAPAEDYEALSSTIEARTGMRVAPLGRAIGSPEMVVALGAVLAARATDRLDLFPRAPTFDARVRGAVTGPSAVTTIVLTAAAVAAFWAVMQFAVFLRTKQDVVRAQAQVAKALPSIERMRQSAEGRRRIAGIRSILAFSQEERRRIGDLLVSLAESAPAGAQLDSFTVERIGQGWKTTVFGRAAGTSGSAAVNAATGMYHRLQQRSLKLKNLDFQVSSYLPRQAADSARGPNPDQLLFTVTFVAPGPAQP